MVHANAPVISSDRDALQFYNIVKSKDR